MVLNRRERKSKETHPRHHTRATSIIEQSDLSCGPIHALLIFIFIVVAVFILRSPVHTDEIQPRLEFARESLVKLSVLVVVACGFLAINILLV